MKQQMTGTMPKATQVLYGYLDKDGFAYPRSAGMPFDDNSLVNMTPIYDKAEWESIIAKNQKRANPATLTGAQTLAEAEEAVASEQEERMEKENRDTGRAAVKAMEATNVEGQTARTKSVPRPPKPIGAPVLTGEDD